MQDEAVFILFIVSDPNYLKNGEIPVIIPCVITENLTIQNKPEP